ncbi:oligosaccharide flippase family protein [Ferruginibacter sp. HRS2-29]|uniref:lipopolysaccharide biosynthesis protein n=1 Tax=Ferruginibacter sp. HRS2-29 TaxID=2487334 RepID=UPI0020CB8525
MGLYTAAGTLAKVISFAALPFFVNVLSEGDIGILNIFNSSIVFLTPIISMGVLYTISVDFFKLPKEDYARVFSTGFLIPIVFSLLLVPVFYIFREPLLRTFHFQYQFVWLIPLCLFLNFCYEAYIILLRMNNKARQFAFMSLLKITVEITLAIILVVFVYQNWYSRALSYVISAALIAILFFFFAIKNGFLVRKFDKKLLKEELSFGLSGLLLQTAVFFIGTSDKFFVMAYFGKDQAGFYSIAAVFASVLFIISSSLMQYLQPILYKKFAEKQGWQNVKGLYKKYMLAMLGTAMLLIAFTWFAYRFILKSSYWEYIHYFYVLCASGFIWSVSNLFLQYIIFHKRKKVIVWFSVMSILLALLVNFSMVHYFSMTALCFGQVITNVLVLGASLYYSWKLKFFG